LIGRNDAYGVADALAKPEVDRNVGPNEEGGSASVVMRQPRHKGFPHQKLTVATTPNHEPRLEAEIVFLRQQLNVLGRSSPSKVKILRFN
jgi:hypothetical protein